MKRRLAVSLFLILVVSGSLLSGSLWQASAVTSLHNMQKALQGVHNAHVSIWENTSIPGGKFYRRELWVQGGLLRQYIKGKLWLISTPDTNWYYIAEEDRLLREDHKQKAVTFDLSSTLREVKGIRGDGKGIRIEAGDDTTLRGQRVALIQVTEVAPSPEELAQEKQQQEDERRRLEESYHSKGLTPPSPEEQQSASQPELRSRRSLYWVDKATDLPLRSEDYEEQAGKWVLVQRSDYDYNVRLPANFFDPQDLLRVGRQEIKRPANKR